MLCSSLIDSVSPEPLNENYKNCWVLWTMGVYMVTHLNGKNLLLTEFRQFWQLAARNCSYLLLRHDDGTFQI